MRLHRFFVSEPIGNKKELTIFDENLLHQWKNVFRLRAGEHMLVLDNSGMEFLATVKLVSKDKAELEIVESRPCEYIPKREVWLFPSLIKNSNFDWILEKATELGVSHIVPVISERSEKKDLNFERSQKIMKEASEQSGRGVLPILHEVATLNDVIKLAQKENIPLVSFHSRTQNFVEKTFEKEKIGTLIGPEGGWSDAELALFARHKIPIYSLGKQVLRAETACVAVLSRILL